MDHLAQLMQDVALESFAKRRENPLMKLVDLYNPNWTEVFDKRTAIVQFEALGGQIGEHYTACQKPDCYWATRSPFGYATPIFFVEILVIIVRSCTEEPMAGVAELWLSKTEEEVLRDLRYVAFRASYDLKLAHATAYREHLIIPPPRALD